LHEAEWVGLKPWEAMVKQKNIDQESLKASLRPLKELYTQETLKKLENNQINVQEKLQPIVEQ
jgi:hypothetical protein